MSDIHKTSDHFFSTSQAGGCIWCLWSASACKLFSQEWRLPYLLYFLHASLTQDSEHHIKKPPTVSVKTHYFTENKNSKARRIETLTLIRSGLLTRKDMSS